MEPAPQGGRSFRRASRLQNAWRQSAIQREAISL
jgi:hypothetical protein